jgi:hypothetical protein
LQVYKHKLLILYNPVGEHSAQDDLCPSFVDPASLDKFQEAVEGHAEVGLCQ